MNVNDLSFSSGFRYERIGSDASGNPLKNHTTFSVASLGFASLTITHNLGYTPFFRAFYTFGDGKYFPLFSGPGSYNIDGNGFQVDDVYATTTILHIDLENQGGSTVSGTIYYRIYAEPQAS